MIPYLTHMIHLTHAVYFYITFGSIKGAVLLYTLEQVTEVFLLVPQKAPTAGTSVRVPGPPKINGRAAMNMVQPGL